MSTAARIFALFALFVMPACDEGDPDSDDNTDGTTTLPEGVTTAAYTGASSPTPEPVCEPGAECNDDSTCGDMECIRPSGGPFGPGVCAVLCDEDIDCLYKLATKCSDEGVCVHDDGSFGGACNLP